MKRRMSAFVSWLRIIAFLLMILLPFLYWCFRAGNVSGITAENRTLSEKPVFRLSDLNSFPQAYETYFNEHLPLRSRMVTANSVVNIMMTKTSPNSSVIIGKDDWLFYNNVSDGDPISQYTGRSAWTEEKLDSAAQHLTAIRDQLAERDIEFVLFFAPNKERMYDQYMPGLYGKANLIYPLGQLVDYLREYTDIRIVYTDDVLRQAIDKHPEHTYYYKYDTHWNDLGAYLGSCALLKELGINLPDYTELQIFHEDSGQTDRDLANMLNLGSWYGADRIYRLHGYSEPGRERTPWELIPTSEAFNDTITVNYETGDPRKLVLVRDSFCTSMLPYVSSCFMNSSFLKNSAYTAEKLQALEPDIVVVELVERYIEFLMDFEVQ